MIKSQIATDGHMLSPLAFFNDKTYLEIQPKDVPRILYSMKANGPLNSLLHGNCYSRLASGRVRFLIPEQDAKTFLLSTQQGQRMNLYQRTKRLLPHEQTSKLFLQMLNLRLKQTGNQLDVVLERINERYHKDKFSAFEYGLWRVKEIEEDEAKRHRRNGSGKRQLTFFTEGR